jgi:adenosylmethionine-8-amino-7-oxononanoate aminotransferase
LRNLNHVFFSDDGSTAVEVGLKMAVQYQRLQGNPKKTKFVALRGGYHGDTVGAMSVGDPTDFHEEFEAITFPTTRVETAEELNAHLLSHSQETAAFIFEPIVQGAAGMRMWDAESLADMATVARAHDVLLIADEVMCGFGRTGPLFACEHANLTPDIMCLSKGLTGGVLPLGATVVREEIYDAFLHDDKKKAFLHGHTFSGNPIACAAAIASMKLLADPELVANRRAIDEFYASTLPDFAELPRVRTVRHRGVIGVVELESDEIGYFNSRTPHIARAMLDEGFLIRPLGNVLYTLCPYRTPITALTELYSNLRILL